jgi:hypothetical protein
MTVAKPDLYVIDGLQATLWWHSIRPADPVARSASD